MVERIRELCKKHGISIAGLEKELGFANGSIVKSGDKIQYIRIKAIADYFGVSTDYIFTGMLSEKESTSGKTYYFDDETAEKAQELFENPDLRILFDAAKDVKAENLQLAAEMLKRFKETAE